MGLFLNPQREAYLRELADDFNASPSHIKDELNNLTETGLLIRKKEGRQIFFSANRNHPVFEELHSMVKKALGMDKILDSIIQRLGNLEKAFLIDDYAEGNDSGIIDLVLVGHIDQENLTDLIAKTEKYINRKIRPLIVTGDEFCTLAPTLDHRPQFVLWQKEAELDKSL
jgi:predicted transcriptional regulator